MVRKVRGSNRKYEKASKTLWNWDKLADEEWKWKLNLFNN